MLRPKSPKRIKQCNNEGSIKSLNGSYSFAIDINVSLNLSIRILLFSVNQYEDRLLNFFQLAFCLASILVQSNPSMDPIV